MLLAMAYNGDPLIEADRVALPQIGDPKVKIVHSEVLSVMAMEILFVVAYLVPPSLLIWGWFQWRLDPILGTVPAILSFIGFVLANVSALLAISTIAYAQVHRFPFYDPLLLRIFRWGALLSAG
jgi:hypothetical protein